MSAGPPHGHDGPATHAVVATDVQGRRRAAGFVMPGEWGVEQPGIVHAGFEKVHAILSAAAAAIAPTFVEADTSRSRDENGRRVETSPLATMRIERLGRRTRHAIATRLDGASTDWRGFATDVDDAMSQAVLDAAFQGHSGTVDLTALAARIAKTVCRPIAFKKEDVLLEAVLAMAMTAREGTAEAWENVRNRILWSATMALESIGVTAPDGREADRTVAIVMPEAWAKGHADRMVRWLERHGLQAARHDVLLMNPRLAAALLGGRHGEPAREEEIAAMTAGPSAVIELRGRDAATIAPALMDRIQRAKPSNGIKRGSIRVAPDAETAKAQIQLAFGEADQCQTQKLAGLIPASF